MYKGLSCFGIEDTGVRLHPEWGGLTPPCFLPGFTCLKQLSFPYFEQFIEEGAVMHHRFAELLRVGLAALIAHYQRLCQ